MLLFNDENQFRILVLADIQVWMPLNAYKQSFIQRMISASAPDLIVLLGDMLCGPLILSERHLRAVVRSILAPIQENGVPYAFIGGNHDQDAPISLEKQILIYRESPNCITPPLSERECRDAYAVKVGVNQDESVAKLLFFDSGATRVSVKGAEYLPANQAQLDFAEKEINGDDCSPAFIFQHVPVPEIYELLNVCDHPIKDAVPGHGLYRKRFLTLGDGATGVLGEAPCPSWENTEQFDGWTKKGNTVAAVFGHDHKNSFTGQVRGVSLIQVSCAGLFCYGTDRIRGGQLLTLCPDKSWTTKALYYRDLP